MSQHGADFRCDGCGQVRGYLSESWSRVQILAEAAHEPVAVLHHCLGCRSLKNVAR